MARIGKILCFIGLHKWKWAANKYWPVWVVVRCERCEKLTLKPYTIKWLIH